MLSRFHDLLYKCTNFDTMYVRRATNECVAVSAVSYTGYSRKQPPRLPLLLRDTACSTACYCVLLRAIACCCMLLHAAACYCMLLRATACFTACSCVLLHALLHATAGYYMLYCMLLYALLRTPPAGYPPRTGTRRILEVGLGLATG